VEEKTASNLWLFCSVVIMLSSTYSIYGATYTGSMIGCYAMYIVFQLSGTLGNNIIDSNIYAECEKHQDEKEKKEE
jgi:hypothetical protein